MFASFEGVNLSEYQSTIDQFFPPEFLPFLPLFLRFSVL